MSSCGEHRRGAWAGVSYRNSPLLEPATGTDSAVAEWGGLRADEKQQGPRWARAALLRMCQGPGCLTGSGFCSRPAEQPSRSAYRTRSLSRDHTRKQAVAPSHGPRVHRAAPSRRCQGRESGRAINSLRPGLRQGLGRGLGRGWRHRQSGCGARGCLGAAATGTHKPCGESWSRWPRGTGGPWWSGWSGGSCQAILPRSASGAGVTLVSLHRWGDRTFPDVPTSG